MKLFTVCVTATALFATPAIAHEEETAVTRSSPTKTQKKADESKKVEDAPKHSGGTDSNGCHTNHKTGEYHCHNPK